MLPEYCCAIVKGSRNYLLLQLRPQEARFAGGLLTCFGGLREPEEDPLTCIKRELLEELGWEPAHAQPKVELWEAKRYIALFFEITVGSCTDYVTEPGDVAIWAPWPSLPGLPLSPWHRSALNAWSSGMRRVDMTDVSSPAR